jgi:pyruvate kinase
VARQLALVWGTQSVVVDTVQTTDDMVALVDSELVARGMARPGDRVVIVAGTPPSTPGGTNTIRVHRLGDLAPRR